MSDFYPLDEHRSYLLLERLSKPMFVITLKDDEAWLTVRLIDDGYVRADIFSRPKQATSRQRSELEIHHYGLTEKGIALLDQLKERLFRKHDARDDRERG